MSKENFVTIGHIVNDTEPSDHAGGGVTYAAVAAKRLGVTAQIITRCSPNHPYVRDLQNMGITVNVLPSNQKTITTFENTYDANGKRTQRVIARQDQITSSNWTVLSKLIPPNAVILVAPVIGEVALDLFPKLASVGFLGVAPQGYFRKITPSGLVEQIPWQTGESALVATQVSIFSNGDRLKLKSEKAEEIESEQLIIKKAENTDDVIIQSSGSASFVIRNKVAAQSHFPLMVNLETNELIVTTPKGSKVVTVLPDKAVEHMLAANVLDQLGGKGGLRWLATRPSPSPVASITPAASQEPSATTSASPVASPQSSPQTSPSATTEPSSTPSASTAPETLNEAIQLTQSEDGTLVYEIAGTKTENFLGLVTVELPRNVIVSAETGELIDVEQSLFTNILDFFSI